MAPFLHPSLFKLFSLSLPLFCLLFSSASSSIAPSPQPSVSALVQILRNRGYSLFATAILAASSTNSWNSTGTILAPPDFAFSFATAKFNNYRRAPPRPSTSLLLSHTLCLPLQRHDLTTRQNGYELRTFHRNRCVFISKNFAGEVSIAGSKKPIGGAYVTIRQPDLYVDDHLAVHGVDGVLDLTSASKCSFPEDPKTEINSSSSLVDRSHLDHAVRALRRRGYGVVATSMAVRQSELMNFPTITIFAPTDESLFSVSDGFRYDFRRHVIPRRFRLQDLERISLGTMIGTLAPGKSVLVASTNGAVTVNGVTIEPSEIYHNRWVVVLAVSRTLDYADESWTRSDFAREADSGLIDSGRVEGVNSPSPSPSPMSIRVGRLTPSSFMEYGEEDIAGDSGRSPSPWAAESVLADYRCGPGASPVNSNGVVSSISMGVEDNEDLYCPVNRGRWTAPSEASGSAPSVAYDESREVSGISSSIKRLERRTLSSLVSSDGIIVKSDHPTVDDVSYYV